MKHTARIILAVVFSFLSSLLSVAGGFSKGTLVKTTTGYCSIEDLKLGDAVLSYVSAGVYSVGVVRERSQGHAPMSTRITTGDVVIDVGVRQQFYCVNKHDWICADQLKPGDTLLSYRYGSVDVECVEVSNELFDWYAISVEPHHTLCISELELVAHNFAILIPIAAWGAGPVVWGTTLSAAKAVSVIGGIVLGLILNHYGPKCDVEVNLDGTVNATVAGHTVAGVSLQESHDDGDSSSTFKVTLPSMPGGSPDPNDPRERKRQVVEASIDAVLNDGKAASKDGVGNKIKHIFENGGHEHYFARLTQKGLSEVDILRRVFEYLVECDLPQSGFFGEIPVTIEGLVICVRGVVHEGVIRIGTMFIKK